MDAGRAVRYGILVVAVAGIALGATRVLTAGAQEAGARGGIKGEITSTVGKRRAPIAGATVTVEWPGGARRQVTGAGGNFEFADLSRGQYMMSVSADGYEPRTALSVTVVQGATSPISVRMRPGGDGADAGPYLVLPVPAMETTAESLQELLNQADSEGYAFVSVLPATALSDTPARHLLVLRKKE